VGAHRRCRQRNKSAGVGVGKVRARGRHFRSCAKSVEARFVVRLYLLSPNRFRSCFLECWGCAWICVSRLCERIGTLFLGDAVSASYLPFQSDHKVMAHSVQFWLSYVTHFLFLVSFMSARTFTLTLTCLQLIAVPKAQMKNFLFGMFFKEFPRSRPVLHGFG
jgi:hypothetical protein